MTKNEIVTLPLAQLFLNIKNPRFEEDQHNQREAMEEVLRDEGDKLAKLASDITHNGLNPSRLLIVKRNGAKKAQYIVLDGNRRITALKLLAEPTLIDSLSMPSKISKKLQNLKPQEPITDVACVVLSQDQAKHWLEIEHVPKQDGVSTLQWTSPAQHRFAGGSPQLEVRDIVRDGGYLEPELRDRIDEVGISNIERIIKTTGVAEKLGIKLSGGKIAFTESKDLATKRLSLLIKNMIETKKKVSELYNAQSRIDYVDEILKGSLPVKQEQSKPAAKPKISPKPKPVVLERKTLIPTDCVLQIQQPRLNRVYKELTELDIDSKPNSVAVLFRVFLELSVDHYGKVNKIQFYKLGKQRKCNNCGHMSAAPKLERNFREKIDHVADTMQSNGIIDKGEALGIKKLAQGQVLDLNAYIHNKDYNPKPSELRLAFDDIQPFIEKLWK